MATIPQIRDRLLKEFSEPQADLLAHVVTEAYDSLATRADLHELTGVVKELADAQKRTECRVEELAAAQGRTEHHVEELAAAQKQTEIQMRELSEAQKQTQLRMGELSEAQRQTERRMGELSEAQRQTERRMGEMSDAQRHTDIQFGEMSRVVSELAALQQQMLIRLDKNEGRSFELFLRTHLPAYLGRHMRRCRVISADQLLDTVEGRLAEEEIDDLLRADLVATAVVDGTPMHLVGEVSCTADREDVVRAARRAGHLRKAGLPAMPFVACEAIGPKTLELASSEQVRVLVEGRLLPEAV
jgi:myosin heavy subunit